MGEIADVLFGLLAFAEVTYGDDLMWLPRKVDSTQDQFNRNRLAVALPQAPLPPICQAGS